MRAKKLASVVAMALVLGALTAWAVPRSQLRGRPEIRIGNEVGYFLYMEGPVLKVRWTTTEPDNHVFRGEVTVASGELTGLRRVSLEDSDRTSLESPTRMVWNATEHRGLDGFDLQLPGPATVKLMLDGRPADPQRIFLGARRRNPSGSEISIGGR